jgi:hypothetical protein
MPHVALNPASMHRVLAATVLQARGVLQGQMVQQADLAQQDPQVTCMHNLKFAAHSAHMHVCQTRFACQ